MHPPFCLRSQRVVTPAGLVRAYVGVRNGRIDHVDLERPAPGWPVEDIGDDVLMPALTDTHVHLNEPGRAEWEGFETGTRAAAAGGVTLLVDMPLNSDPVTTSVAALHAKHHAAVDKLHVDCGFWGGVIPGNQPQLDPMIDLGVMGFKAFLCHSGIEEFPLSSEADLRLAMPILADRGVPLLVHAELESELREAQNDGDPRSYSRYLHSRPKEWEDAAVAMMIGLVKRTGCRVHIVHLSSAGALPLLRQAKAEGLPITAETCPHYLGITAEGISDGATEFKCAPPIREKANRERLWAGVLDGTIDFVVTDHSPCLPALKRSDTGDFTAAWGGISSLQIGLRAVWTSMRSRGLDIHRLSQWMSLGPAQFLRRGERGRIVAGATADLVQFAPEEETFLDPAASLHRHPTTPWRGILAGNVRRTWMRGEPVWDDGIVGPRRGRVVMSSFAAGPGPGSVR